MNDIGDSVQLTNQERFLGDILAWAQQPILVTSDAGYDFDPRDGPVCRERFLENEDLYLGSTNQQAEDQAALDNLYAMILGLMESNSVRLVDNNDFIEWATEETLPELREQTKMVILRRDGAEYITDIS